jgi:hypothetical protein
MPQAQWYPMATTASLLQLRRLQPQALVHQPLRNQHVCRQLALLFARRPHTCAAAIAASCRQPGGVDIASASRPPPQLLLQCRRCLASTANAAVILVVAAAAATSNLPRFAGQLPPPLSPPPLLRS